MNVGIGNEVRAISFLGIFVSNFRYSALQCGGFSASPVVRVTKSKGACVYHSYSQQYRHTLVKGGGELQS